MGSYFNFKSFAETEMPQPEGNGLKPLGSFPLTRQSSIFSLTFDELQNSLGKDFGSMNMDELLKSIWTAEETQAMASVSGLAQGVAPSENFNLQRQGSLTLPRTLSLKTVDEVWKDLLNECNEKDGSGISGSHLQQREPTLGEMTLEEFLNRAGVVREDAQPIVQPNNGAFFGEISQPNHQNPGVILGYQQQPVQNNVVIDNCITENKNTMPPIFPKQAAVTFTTSSFPQANGGYLVNSGARDPVGRTGDTNRNKGFVQSSVIQSGSPGSQLSSDGNGKSTVDTSSVSPSPYTFSGVRGRRSGATVEKAMERRHRRMIKNRESAARSRARKQAYTLELEAEIAKLKEMNNELQRKQEEIMEMQKNQMLETMNRPRGSKKRCLRRTLTGPW